ncbi:MAG: YfdX family protein [Limisphaerales bacterium]
MKQTNNKWIGVIATSVVLGLGSASAAQNQNQNQSQPSSDVQEQRKEAEQKARPEVEQQRKQSQQQAEQSLDKEAIAAINETAQAVKALSENKTNEALAAIERATGKINVLTARNPATALLPVAVEVEAIEAAPQDVKEIRERGQAAIFAVGSKDFPAGRVLLEGLISELRVRTRSLPLGSYPIALREAARLIDQKKTKEASDVLLTGLNTLVVVDQVAPLPLLLAKSAIDEAQKVRDQDKDSAQKHLAAAKQELQRAKELGYASKDPEYVSLDKAISNLEKQIRGNGDTSALFANLKQRVQSFFKRQSESKRS